jgi:hypothetical protein
LTATTVTNEIRQASPAILAAARCDGSIVRRVISGPSNPLLDAAVLIFFTSLPRDAALLWALSKWLH